MLFALQLLSGVKIPHENEKLVTSQHALKLTIYWKAADLHLLS